MSDVNTKFIRIEDLAETAIYQTLRDRGIEPSTSRRMSRDLIRQGMTARRVLRGFDTLGPDWDVLRDALTLHGVVIRE